MRSLVIPVLSAFLLTAGAAWAQTEAPVTDDALVPSEPAPAEGNDTPGQPENFVFTPVPVQDRQVPEPIAARAVPPDYRQQEHEPAGGEMDPSPAEPAPALAPGEAAVDGDDSTAEAATPPDRGDADGTSSGDAGSSGWTGGLGGSMIGTNPSGAVSESTTWQPPTARGLDLEG